MESKQNCPTGKNPLGYEPVAKLLMKYAVPSVVSMVVMAIYNIVDQLFIGWGVGYLGNSATTVAFPLVTVGNALALLVGNGTAAFVSLELGKGDTSRLRRAMGNAFTLLIGSGILYAVVYFLFQDSILIGLGADSDILPYARDYTTYIMMGMPFVMVGTALANIIRADGAPRYSMFAILSGAVLNTILDPIFIFVLDMGVKGAAIATAISQVVATIFALYYVLRKARYVPLEGRQMALDRKLVGRVVALGSSSFITQAAITVVNVVLNNSLRYYGGASAIGSAIPLAAMGIVLKINAILISVILGVVIGSQPILGFNYSAGNYHRVRKTFLTAVTITTIFSGICCALFIFVPEVFVAAFRDDNELFNEFAAQCMRIYLCAVVSAGIQIPSANYFQAIGKPLMAMSLTMTRQLIILVPMILILPLFFGLNGILYAGPVADLSSMAITLFFIAREMRRLVAKSTALSGEAAMENG